jgi:site-specific DNA-methyltransferase (adenine-specific)
MAKQAREVFAPRDAVILSEWQHPASGLPALPAGYFAHTITDPPYSEYVHEKKWTGGNKASGPGVKSVTFDALTAEELELVAAEIVRVTRGWALVFCADDDMRAWRDALSAAGALRWPTCIWTKPNGTPQFRGEGPSQPCEHIVTAWCGEGRPVWNGGGKMGHYNISTESSRLQETQKPLRLISNLVLDFTMPGDLIADPFFGAGTTGVAARRCGRSFVGWEADQDRGIAATDRVMSAREQLHMEQLLHNARPRAFGEEDKRSVPAPEQTRIDGIT